MGDRAGLRVITTPQSALARIGHTESISSTGWVRAPCLARRLSRRGRPHDRTQPSIVARRDRANPRRRRLAATWVEPAGRRSPPPPRTGPSLFYYDIFY